MSDLISREEAVRALGDAHFKNYGTAIMVIQALPSAEPKKGKWIEHGTSEGFLIERYTCSECGWYIGTRTKDYCPNCGARMEGEK